MKLSDIYNEIMLEKNASEVVVDEDAIVKEAEAQVVELENLAGNLYVIGQDFARMNSGMPKLAEEKEAEKEDSKEDKAEDKGEDKKEEVKSAVKEEMKKSAEYREYLINKYCE